MWAAREISYLFGQYKKLKNQWTGAITRKSLASGILTPHRATASACCYFGAAYLADHGQSLQREGHHLHGSGNVATYIIKCTG